MSAGGYASQLDAGRLTGLRPRVWVCVGAGFSREDFKQHLLDQGLGISADAILNLNSICLKIWSAERAANAPLGSDLAPVRVLQAPARQEVLRTLLAESRISARMTELKRLRRQGNFLRRLDQALQSGRMTFAHLEEHEVYDQRLAQRLGPGRVRAEITALASAYEAWLEAMGLEDPVTILRKAISVLTERGWPKGLAQPEAVHCFSVQHEESLERAFWECLARHVDVRRIGPCASALATIEPRSSRQVWDWQLWHTLDDAAEELAERLAQVARTEGPEVWARHVVLIPDTSTARRSVVRALASHGVALADPRDPTRLRWDEGVKWATLPLSCVSGGFERGESLAYLRAHAFAEAEYPVWVREISARGVRLGLAAYAGGALSGVHSRLTEISQLFGGRKRCEDLADAHVRFLRAQAGSDPERQWIPPFFEALWKGLNDDLKDVGFGDRKAPLRFWWERLKARLLEAPAPVERAKPVHGVALYRLSQAPLQGADNIWVLGLPPQWLSGEGVGDYWFAERDREILAGEFAVRSAREVRVERLAALRDWFAQSERTTFLDAAYDADGRERETLYPVLAELAQAVRAGGNELELAEKPREMGAHARWLASFGSDRSLQPQEVKLSPLPSQAGGAPTEITATALDHYSSCAFQALAYDRWRVRDAREPDGEPWPDSRGNILHAAVKILVASRDLGGAFAVAPREALEQAWRLKPPRGMIQSARLARLSQARMLKVLERFCEKEREYAARSGTRATHLDDLALRLEFEDIAIVGTPDRIDEHPDGLFVMDYKTSSNLPQGVEMLERGYRLQLPFYALAAQRQLKKPVIGLQFVELSRTGGRARGLFFKKWNGKEPGRLTNARSNARSLMNGEPESAWSELEGRILDHARAYARGEFAAQPKRQDKECAFCQVKDLCGFRRKAQELTAEEGAIDG